MTDKPWSVELAVQWLKIEKWTPREATMILLKDDHPAKHPRYNDLDRARELVSPLLSSGESLHLAIDSIPEVGKRPGFPPSRWIEMFKLLGEPIPAKVRSALQALKPQTQAKKIRSDKLLTHQHIIVALSTLGSIDLSEPGTAQKILNKMPYLTLDTVTKAIKAAVRAVKEDIARRTAEGTNDL
jgi:hypothetical protein